MNKNNIDFSGMDKDELAKITFDGKGNIILGTDTYLNTDELRDTESNMNELNLLFDSIDRCNDIKRQMEAIEKNLYKSYLDKKWFSPRLCLDKLNIRTLVDILTEKELNTDEEDLLLTLVVRYAEDMMIGTLDGGEIWESASAYDFSKIITKMKCDISVVPIEELSKFLSIGLDQYIFMLLPLRDDAPLSLYMEYIEGGMTNLQEILLSVYILDNLGISVSESTSNAILALVNDDDFYMVSDYPLIESIKNYAVMVLKGQ